MHGIGAPGSAQAQLWTRVAAKHGVACPYGVNNPAEWNHCQPTRIKMVQSDSPLVKMGRLSVVELTAQQYAAILELAAL